jgi:putative ABC transport system permease protein
LRATGTPAGRLTALFCVEAGLLGLLGSLLGFALGLLLARYTLGEVSRTVSTLYVAVRAREVAVPPWLFPARFRAARCCRFWPRFPAALEAGASRRARPGRASLHATCAPGRAVRVARPGDDCGRIDLVPPAISRARPGSVHRDDGHAGRLRLLRSVVVCAAAHARKRGQVLGARLDAGGIALQRGAHRASLVVAALMVSLAMTIGLAVMVLSFRNSVSRWVDNTISADLFVAPARGFSGEAGPGLPPEVISFAKQLPQVRSLDTIRGAETTIGNQPVFIAANSPALARDRRPQDRVAADPERGRRMPSATFRRRAPF